MGSWYILLEGKQSQGGEICNVPSLGTLELLRRNEFSILNLTMLLGDLLLKVKLISHVVTRGRGGIRRTTREKLKSHCCEDKKELRHILGICLIYYSNFQFSLVRVFRKLQLSASMRI